MFIYHNMHKLRFKKLLKKEKETQMKVLMLLMVIVAFVSGCTTVQYNGGATTVKNISFPEIGAIATASIGDDLLSKGRLMMEEILTVHSSIDGAAYNIPAKDYAQIGFDTEQNFYEIMGVTQNVFADPAQAIAIKIIEPEIPEICVISIVGTGACYEADYSLRSQRSIKGNSFQQTLIYSGRIGNRVNVGYREFSNDWSRLPFSNEVEYDLSVSKTISYKGAQIEIIKADNNSITYRVISNFR